MSGRTVWKYHVTIDALVVQFTQVQYIPDGARFLHAAEQDGDISLWYEIPDPAADPEPHRYQVFGTGNAPIGDHLSWLATVPMIGGQLILHIYEVTGEIDSAT